MAGLRIALTCDDAPWSEHLGGAPRRKDAMDEVREVLLARGITRCVAFVIGTAIEGQGDQLRRWLDAGFELGNHTEDHPRASRVSSERFLDSVRRCHERLDSLGAFDHGRTRWFRFPYLDRGAPLGQRKELQEGFAALGYRLAHATVDFYDHLFEQRYLAALARSDARAEAAVCARYRAVAVESMRVKSWALRREHGHDLVLVPYFHFGAVSMATLPSILDAVNAHDVEWCSLDEAMSQRPYGLRDGDAELRSGLVNGSIQSSVPWRCARLLVKLTAAAGVLNQRTLGPRYPYV